MKNTFLIFIFCLALSACGGGGSDPETKNNSQVENLEQEGSEQEGSNETNVFPYRSNTQYASVLKQCAIASNQDSSCTLDTLPLMGMTGEAIDKNKILERVVVSHTWMGNRFAEVLDTVPTQLLQLFQSTAVIVIAADVRPSFYWTISGGIYLDPAYLWLTNAEKATINQQDDFRADFGSAIPYVFASRYMKNRNPAYYSYSLTGNQTRELNDIILPITRLLYHELAHANDFFPANQMQSFANRSIKMVDAIEAIKGQRLSDSMGDLTASDLSALAGVLYRGEEATTAQTQASTTTLGNSFQYDGAAHLYAYSNQYEDFAMLIEATMMKYHYDAELAVAFLQLPDESNTDPVCDDYKVGWGAHNRLTAPSTRSRAALGTQLLLPTLDLSGFFQNLSQGATMQVGQGWCWNLVNNPAARGIANRNVQQEIMNFEQDFLSPEY